MRGGRKTAALNERFAAMMPWRAFTESSGDPNRSDVVHASTEDSSGLTSNPIQPSGTEFPGKADLHDPVSFEAAAIRDLPYPAPSIEQCTKPSTDETSLNHVDVVDLHAVNDPSAIPCAPSQNDLKQSTDCHAAGQISPNVAPHKHDLNDESLRYRAVNATDPEVLEDAPSTMAKAPPMMAAPTSIGSKTSTPVLRPYRKLNPEDTVDLVDTIQTIFEEDSLVKENGVLLLDAPHLIPVPGQIKLPPTDYNFEATSQRVMVPAKYRGHGLVVIKSAEAKLKDQSPSFDEVKDLSQEEMEDVFQKHIVETNENHARHPYFNIDLSDFACRPRGSFELTCGSPMDKLSYIAGVNTPYGYYSKGVSHFGAHVEDWRFASYNVVFAGATKLWIAVKPTSKQLFEEKVREIFPTAGTCAQFIRHLALNFAPSTLRKWGVEHFFVPQNPGQVVAVSGTTYHWGINTGHNYAEAINFCMDKHWSAPEDFKNCYHGCGIADDMIPLPKPVPEEGDMDEKKQRAIERDVQFRILWAKEQAMVEAKQPKPTPRIKERRLREDTARAQSIQPKQLPTGHADRQRLQSESIVPAPPPRRSMPSRLSNASASNAPMLDSINVNSQTSRPNQRPRPMTRQPQYLERNKASSDADDTDSEHPVPRLKDPRRLNHSRHNSGQQHLTNTFDADTLAQQIAHAMKTTVVPWLQDFKKTGMKQDELTRTQIQWQAKNAELIQENTNVMRRLFEQQLESQRMAQESQQRAEHRLMRIHQALENVIHQQTRLLERAESQALSTGNASQPRKQRAGEFPHPDQTLNYGSRGSSVASGEARSQSDKYFTTATRSVQQAVAGNMSVPPQQEARTHLPPIVCAAPPDPVKIQAMLSGLSGNSISSSSEATSTRHSGSTIVSGNVTDEGSHSSPEFSPITPRAKSLELSLLDEPLSLSSISSQIPGEGTHDDARVVHEKVIDISATQDADVGGDMAVLELGAQYDGVNEKERPTKMLANVDTAVPEQDITLATAGRRCRPCVKRGRKCDQKLPHCADCLDRGQADRCSYPPPARNSMDGTSHNKRPLPDMEDALETTTSNKRLRGLRSSTTAAERNISKATERPQSIASMPSAKTRTRDVDSTAVNQLEEDPKPLPVSAAHNVAGTEKASRFARPTPKRRTSARLESDIRISRELMNLFSS